MSAALTRPKMSSIAVLPLEMFRGTGKYLFVGWAEPITPSRDSPRIRARRPDALRRLCETNHRRKLKNNLCRLIGFGRQPQAGRVNLIDGLHDKYQDGSR